MVINSEEFRVAFGLMEGEEWTARSILDCDGPTIGAAVELLHKIKARGWDEEPTLLAVIHGNGGGRRYYLEVPTGEVYFSRFHAEDHQVEDAKALGFKIS